MQYQIITAGSLPQLEAHVNNELRHGWIVTGGLATCTAEARDILQIPSTIFIQAMIHPDKDPTQ
jgi:hypothetical protein